MIAEIDEDNNDVIDFDEFVASRKVSATYTAEQVRGASAFERAPPGHIKVDRRCAR